MRLKALIHVLLRDHFTIGQMSELMEAVDNQMLRKDEFAPQLQPYEAELVRHFEGPCDCRSLEEHQRRKTSVSWDGRPAMLDQGR